MLTDGIVVLREIRTGDLPTLYRINADLDTWEQRNASPPWPISYEAWLALYEQRRDDSCEFAICTPDGELIGRGGMFNEDTFSRIGDVGLALLPEHRGRGYGTAALRLLVDFCFARRNLNRVQLDVLAVNAAAIASYRKVGFVEEGRFRQSAWVKGAYVDTLKMAILRDEWVGPPAGA